VRARSVALEPDADVQEARTTLTGSAVRVGIACANHTYLAGTLRGIELALPSTGEASGGVAGSRACLTTEVVSIARFAAVDRAISAKFKCVPEDDVR
jgi:hypothetical protein